jgi:hypothetical protein
LNDAARKLGREVLILPASVEADFENAFAALAEKRASALVDRSIILGIRHGQVPEELTDCMHKGNHQEPMLSWTSVK